MFVDLSETVCDDVPHSRAADATCGAVATRHATNRAANTKTDAFDFVTEMLFTLYNFQSMRTWLRWRFFTTYTRQNSSSLDFGFKVTDVRSAGPVYGGA